MKKILITLIFLINIFFSGVQTINSAPIYCGGDRWGLPPLVVCGKSGNGQCTEPCELKHIGSFLNNLVYFMIYFMFLVLPLYIIYVGVEIIRGQGNTEVLTKAKSMAFKVVISLVLFLLAWLIMYTIAQVFGVRSNIPSFLIQSGNDGKSQIIDTGVSSPFRGSPR